MANTGFTTLVNGVDTDLIKIFEPLTGTKLTYNTNYVNSAGLDLRDIFEPYVAGDDTAVITKYTTLSGGLEKDLNVIFGIPLPPYPNASNVMSQLGYPSKIIIYNKNVIVTDQQSTVWYSTNSGKTFTRSTGVPSSTSGNYAFALYGTNAIILVPGSPSAVYTSSNSGATWTNRMSLTGITGSYCSIYENYAMITLANNTIYLSNNYGVSWTSISVVNAYFIGCAISYDSTTSKYIAVCCSWETVSSMYYCTNFTGLSSSTTFTKGTNLLTASDHAAISLVGRNGIAVSDNTSYLGLWYTSNGGQTWTKSLNYSTLTGFSRCSLSATGLGIAMRINVGDTTQYVTRDYGVTWSNATIFPAITFTFALYNNILVSTTFLGGNNIVYYGTYS